MKKKFKISKTNWLNLQFIVKKMIRNNQKCYKNRRNNQFNREKKYIKNLTSTRMRQTKSSTNKERSRQADFIT